MSSAGEHLQFDLGRLAVLDPSPVDPNILKLNEDDALDAYTSTNVQSLVDRLFALPSEETTVGTIVTLPKSEYKLPRQLPCPADKPLTKWEQFAKEKGIQKKKKEKMVWDSATRTYKPRWGYGGTNDVKNDWLLEHPEGKEYAPGEDPFLEKKRAKKDRIAKNSKQELANQKAAAKKMGVSMPEMTPQGNMARKSRSEAALELAQTATASFGRFDTRVEGEKAPKVEKKKVKSMAGSDLGDEAKAALSLLNRVVGTDSTVLDADKAARKLVSGRQKARGDAKHAAGGASKAAGKPKGKSLKGISKKASSRSKGKKK